MDKHSIIQNESEFETEITMTKNGFNRLKDACNDIDSVFDTLQMKVDKLSQFYEEFVTSNTGHLMIFGLDSFNFQNRLINNDIQYMQQMKNMLFNRIYADYYKLYNIIVTYIKSNLQQSKLYTSVISTNKTFPKYNYLNIYEFYDFTITNDVFYEIIGLLQQMHDYCKSLDIQLQAYKQKKRIGLNIDNFVHTHEYRLHTLTTQINLYLNYLEFFIQIHTKYLQRFITRMKIIHAQLNDDIKLDSIHYSYDGQGFSGKNMMYSKNHIIDADSTTSLSPVEKRELTKILHSVSNGTSDLAKEGISHLIDGSHTIIDNGVIVDDMSISLEEAPPINKVINQSQYQADEVSSLESEQDNDSTQSMDSGITQGVVKDIVDELVDNITKDETNQQ